MTTLMETTRRDGVMKPGEWRLMEHQIIPATTRSAMVCCPGCGRIGSLLDHTIDPDGSVTPSLDCPFEQCDFHEFVKLADWKA